MKQAKPAVIAVSSHVARGSVGNRAMVTALELSGFPVWSVPTVLLPWHPGHGRSHRIVPPDADFARFADDLCRAPWIGEVSGIVSGYLGSAGQADAVARLVSTLKARNPSAIYLCDPVIGDAGGLYVTEAVASAIRDRLVPRADVITPNRHELAWLAGGSTESIADAVAAARRIGVPKVLVTSAVAGEPGRTGNMLVESGREMLATHDAFERVPSGTGDLTAALFLAGLLSGDDMMNVLEGVTGKVAAIAGAAIARGSDELMIETDSSLLHSDRHLVPVLLTGVS